MLHVPSRGDFECEERRKKIKKKEVEKAFEEKVMSVIVSHLKKGERRVNFESCSIMIPSELKENLVLGICFPDLDRVRRRITRVLGGKGYKVRWVKAGWGSEVGCTLLPWEVQIK